MKKLLEALGLGDRVITRLVLVFDIEEPTTAYYVEQLPEKGASQVAEAVAAMKTDIKQEAVAGVLVDGNANVYVEVKDGQRKPQTD